MISKRSRNSDYLNTLLRNAGYQIVERTYDYIVLTHEGVTRKKNFDHPKHAENTLKKLLREKEYFETWELVEDN